MSAAKQQMVVRQLDKRGEAGTFRAYSSTSGDRIVGSAVTSYGSDVTVKVMPFLTTEAEEQGSSSRRRRIIVGAKELTAASITEINAQDEIQIGSVVHEVVFAEAVRHGGIDLYYDVQTASRS